MRFLAKSRFVRYSPFKLRSLVDVIRGKNVQFALSFLDTLPLKKSEYVFKTLKSAAANAKHLQNLEPDQLKISDIRVDHGPSYNYYKPGAMGRANVIKRRFSHISVEVSPLVTNKEA